MDVDPVRPVDAVIAIGEDRLTNDIDEVACCSRTRSLLGQAGRGGCSSQTGEIEC